MKNLYRVLMNVVGSHHPSFRAGVPEAPTMRTEPRHFPGVEHLVASNNNGFEVWFGYPEKWNHHIDEREARRLFWWLLFRWYGQARWFGLRRPIYYWALRGYLRALRHHGVMS